MPVLFLNLLKLIFIALIYLFLWQVARAIAAHLGAGGETGRRTRGGSELVVVRSESQAGSSYPIRNVLVVGRNPESDVVLDDPYASDFHLRLVAADGRVMLYDLGSTNGTYVNGRRVTSPLAVSRGDAVQIGKTVLEVR